MTKKMTKRERFNILLTYAEVQADPEMVEFIEHEIILLEKKNSGDKKPTATQQANAEIKEAIVASMEPNRFYTITEMIKEIPACADLTNQKVAVLVRQLMEDGKVEKTVDKRKSLFSVVAE